MTFNTIRSAVGSSASTSARTQTESVSLKKTVSNQSNPEIPQQATKKEIPEKKLEEAVHVVNDFLKMVDVRFEYKVDEKTKKEVVEVYDQQTGEKIKQYPPEEILNMIEKMYDMLGILVDDRI